MDKFDISEPWNEKEIRRRLSHLETQLVSQEGVGH